MDKDAHIQLLKVAEQQFRLACTVNFLVAVGKQPLDVPLEQTFGRHRTRYQEFALRPDQADYSASALERVATFAMSSALRQAFAECVPDAKAHERPEVVFAYQISRLVRNAFGHHVLRPIWSIDRDCQDRKFEVENVVTLDTTGLHGRDVNWRDYGGHLAMWRLSQWVRFNVLDDVAPADRREPQKPSIEAYQQGREIFVRQSEPPAND